eukprot:79642_1
MLHDNGLNLYMSILYGRFALSLGTIVLHDAPSHGCIQSHHSTPFDGGEHQINVRNPRNIGMYGICSLIDSIQSNLKTSHFNKRKQSGFNVLYTHIGIENNQDLMMKEEAKQEG